MGVEHVDREAKSAHLGAVERAVASSALRIAHRELLANLDRDGQDRKGARAVLASPRRVQAQQVAICDLRLKALHTLPPFP